MEAVWLVFCSKLYFAGITLKYAYMHYSKSVLLACYCDGYVLWEHATFISAYLNLAVLLITLPNQRYTDDIPRPFAFLIIARHFEQYNNGPYGHVAHGDINVFHAT